jgi:hypothetical protein
MDSDTLRTARSISGPLEFAHQRHVSVRKVNQGGVVSVEIGNRESMDTAAAATFFPSVG